MKVVLKVSCVCMFVLLYSTASYGVMLNISNGILLGASEVNVNGDLYDMAFKDGICADLYDGCDQHSDFPFFNPLVPDNGRSLGLAANIALIDQVFIDSSLGAFDSIPSLTNGCFAVGGCQIRTPLFLTGGGGAVGIQWHLIGIASMGISGLVLAAHCAVSIRAFKIRETTPMCMRSGI